MLGCWIFIVLKKNIQKMPFLARLYQSTGRAIAVTTALALASMSALALAALLKMLKVFG